MATYVLVHGAWSASFGYRQIAANLRAAGHIVFAPTMTGLGERAHLASPSITLSTHIADITALIDYERLEDIILVGHSYGGMVITGAAADNPNVKSLVYIAAYVPDLGDNIGGLNAGYSAPLLATGAVPDTAGFLYVDRAKFHEIFCADVPEGEARIMAATQKPLTSAAFGQTVEAVAWKSVPAWAMVATADNAINPDLERFMYQRAGATTVEVDSSHVPFISQPQAVVELINEAAK
jgi:pimeloyl-ACP methyl ester carboxylesterase